MKWSYFFLILFTIQANFSGFSQHLGYFEEIDNFNSEKLTEKPILIYFHSDRCAPCKRMDKEVLSEENIQTYLKDNFETYHVYGLDSLASHYRSKFDILGNPFFVFLNNKYEEIHRVCGYLNQEDFIKECEIINSESSLIAVKKKFNDGNRDKEFLYRYIWRLHKAAQIDSATVFEYFNVLQPSDFEERKHVESLLYFGYYSGKIWVPYKSNYYELIKNLEKNPDFEDLREVIRVRMVFTMYFYYLENKDKIEDKNGIFSELESFENGHLNLFKDVFDDKYHGYLVILYPSLYFRLQEMNCENEKISLMDKYFEKHFNDSETLNNLAWGIYEGDYNVAHRKGLEMINRSLELKEGYHNTDTKAALLYLIGDFVNARNTALKAIEMAKSKGLNYDSAGELLVKIENAIENKNSD